MTRRLGSMTSSPCCSCRRNPAQESCPRNRRSGHRHDKGVMPGRRSPSSTPEPTAARREHGRQAVFRSQPAAAIYTVRVELSGFQTSELKN